MGDGQASRAHIAAAPRQYVQIKNSGSPAATGAAAIVAFNCLERRKKLMRVKPRFDEHHRIGEVTSRSALGGVDQDRGGIEQPELLVQPGNRGRDHLRRAAMAAVRSIRPERDGVKVRSVRQEIRLS